MTVACIDVPLESAAEFGVMSIDNDWRVTSFAEKPEKPAPIPGQPGQALVSMGIYVFNASFLFEASHSRS